MDKSIINTKNFQKLNNFAEEASVGVCHQVLRGEFVASIQFKRKRIGEKKISFDRTSSYEYCISYSFAYFLVWHPVYMCCGVVLCMGQYDFASQKDI